MEVIEMILQTNRESPKIHQSVLPQIQQLSSNVPVQQNANAPLEVIERTSEHEKSSVFRDTHEIFFDKLCQAQSNIDSGLWTRQETIALGHKENEMFILVNPNKQRYGTKSRFKHPTCDYHPWNSDGNTNQYRLVDDQLIWKGWGDTKDFGISEAEKVVIKTIRLKLQEDVNYQKKITYVTQAPLQYRHTYDYCTIEYVGQDTIGPNRKPHPNSKAARDVSGNALNPSHIATKTNPEALEEAKAKLKHKVPQHQVLSEGTDTSNPQKSLKDSKQVRNLAFNLPEAQALRSGNLASGIMKIETMRILDETKLKYDDYVRTVVYDTEGYPAVYCYKDWQIKDMVTNCSVEEGKNFSVITFDKTHGIGDVVQSSFSYQNKLVRRKVEKTHPAMFGPQMLHQKSNFETYNDFMGHVRGRMAKEAGEAKKYFIATDEELSIVKAVECTFPECTHLLCALHLKRNVQKKLEYVKDARAKNKVIDAMFNPFTGLTAASSKDDFTLKEAEVDWTVFENVDPGYCLNMRKKILEKVLEPKWESKGVIGVNHNTNVAESMNNVTKNVLDHRQHKYPVLIHKQESIVNAGMTKLKQSCYGQGDLEQLPETAEYASCTVAQWSRLTEAGEWQKFIKLISGPPKNMSNGMQKSDCGTITIRNRKGAIKQPQQKDRVRAHRTRSAPKTPKAKKSSKKTSAANLMSMSIEQIDTIMDEEYGPDDENITFIA